MNNQEVNLDLYTKDAVNLLAPEELDENGIHF